MDLIGRDIPLIDGKEKATGRMVFTADINRPGMLYGMVLRSPYPHARIVQIDDSRAWKQPGVRAIITGKNRQFPFYSVAGQKVLDEQLLATDKVHFIGDEVAVVAATDRDTAAEALRLIKVEYEQLPPVFDPLSAMADGVPLVHQSQASNIPYRMEFSRGDINEGFAKSEVIVEETFNVGHQYQGYLEPHAAVAECDISGRVTLWLPMQSPTLGRITYAAALGIPENKIRIVQMPIGGGFGGKLEYKLHALCALLAKETGQPVKMVNTRAEDFQAGLPRVPMQIKMKLGVRSDGTLAAKESEIIADSGAYVNYSHGILLSACHRHDNLYRLQNIHTKGYLVYTNKVPTGCFRGFGNPQVHFALESILDMAADRLGMDPAELRLRNATQTGDVTVHGWQVLSCGLSDCINQSTNGAGWQAKRLTEIKPDTKDQVEKKAGQEALQEARYAKGIGLACCLHVSGNRTFLPYFDGASCRITVNEQGMAIVFVGETDLGQGARTTFAQIAAHELGLPITDVMVTLVDTDINPHGLGTFGDRATTLGGNAVRLAAADARRQILAIAAEETGSPAEKLVINDGIITGEAGIRLSVAEIAQLAWSQLAGGHICGQGVYIPPDVTAVHPDTKYGNISCSYPFVAQVAEVEVDRWTGRVKVNRIVAAHDVGKVINPLLANGQVDGAVAQGIGYTLMEDMGIANGKVSNKTFSDYNMPRITDMPEIKSILVESNDPNGPYGAKGLAEPALTPTAAAIANAIYNAVGVRITELPVTAEKVFRALKERFGCP
ncbi:MAG: xanthine dehydrogenase family protein molybdopterin-binding subunit [Desulfitobacteriaceae bacterium]